MTIRWFLRCAKALNQGETIRRTYKVVALTVVLVLALSVGLTCKRDARNDLIDGITTDRISRPEAENPQAEKLRTIQVWGFEKDLIGWNPVDPAVKASLSTDQKYAGNASLRVEGTSYENKWNFLGGPLFDLQSRSFYQISCWMRVEKWSRPQFPPFIKCQLDQDGVFLANFNSEVYDLNRKGEWQPLSISFTTLNKTKLQGRFYLEKGTADFDVEAVVDLDEVKVEMEEPAPSAGISPMR